MILILNNKANLTLKEVKNYERKIRKYNLIVLPTACYLPIFQKGKYILGSQDVSEFEEKNRTGEINVKQLKSLNVKYSLIGHSERRIYNKETDKIILNKINRCFENNITPLYCIGESNTETKEDELKKQLLKDMQKSQLFTFKNYCRKMFGFYNRDFIIFENKLFYLISITLINNNGIGLNIHFI